MCGDVVVEMTTLNRPDRHRRQNFFPILSTITISTLTPAEFAVSFRIG